MRASLLAIADELKRLKTQGMRHVPVSEEGLQALRKAVASAGVMSAAPRPVADGGGPVLKMDRADRTHLGIATAEPSSGASHVAERPTSKGVLKEIEISSHEPVARIELPEGTKEEKLSALRARLATDALYLEQAGEGAPVVFAEGALDAPILICGEHPGSEEVAQGRTFVGEAGKKLTQIIEAMGLKRDAVFLTYLVPWRHKDAASGPDPERNARPPTDADLRYAVPFLRAQIEIVQPKVVITLGASTSRAVLGAKAFRIMTDVRGKWFDFEGWPVLVTYDPSYVLRQSSKSSETKAKRVVWEAMLMAMEKVGLPISEKQRGYFLS